MWVLTNTSVHGGIVDKKRVQACGEGLSTYASFAKALQEIPDYCMAKLCVTFDIAHFTDAR